MHDSVSFRFEKVTAQNVSIQIKELLILGVAVPLVGLLHDHLSNCIIK